MENFTRLGRAVFGLGMLGFGVLNVVFASPATGLETFPAWLPAPMAWTYVTGLLLIVGGVCTMAGYPRPRIVAIGLAWLLSLGVLLLRLPALLEHVREGNMWTTMFECLAMCCGAWVLADGLSSRVVAGSPDPVRVLAEFSRYGFGISLPVFGALHFIYWQYTASVIPEWIPGSPVFWTYFTGCAHVAAGLAIVSGVLARWAAKLLGVMFTSWVLMLHIPRVLAHAHQQNEWTSLCVTVTLSGVAWLMAGYLGRSDRFTA